MKPTQAMSLLLTLGIVSAAPSRLEERAPSNAPINWEHGPDSEESFQCGKETYTGHEIYLAAQRGVNLQLADETRGRYKYPHTFKHNDSKGKTLEIPDRCPPDENRHEFPLVSPGPYDGGKKNEKQGEERVIYYWVYGDRSHDGNPNVVYCGIMTHTGTEKGSFVLC